MLFHIGVLIVMAAVGSIIAGRGLQLFYTSSDQSNNPKDC